MLILIAMLAKTLGVVLKPRTVTLAHGIGLEVHEGPRLSSRSDHVLQPGNVVTVEPGVYLPGRGGVRIEDDVAVTDTGSRVLTSASRDLIQL